MKPHLLKFSDFALGKKLEENDAWRDQLRKAGLIAVTPKDKVISPRKESSRDIPKKFFSDHWMDRTNHYGDRNQDQSRIIEFNPESRKYGFTLKENLLDSNGNPIENLNLEDVLKETGVDSETLIDQYLPGIFQYIARNAKLEKFMRAQTKKGLKFRWCAFLGKICLKKGNKKFFLDFVRGDIYNQYGSIDGGTFWGAGENHSQERDDQIEVITPLILPSGNFDNAQYSERIKALMAQNIKAKEYGGYVHNVNFLIKVDMPDIQLVFPLGKSFHVTIDLDQKGLEFHEITKGFREQIDFAYDERYKNVFKENPGEALDPNPGQTKNEKKLNLFSFSEFLSETKRNLKKDKGPCWQGYRQVGTKTKNGRLVPNCVPIGKSKTYLKESDEIEDLISGFEDLGINEKPRVWFIDWESDVDGRSRNLWIVEGYNRPEVILKIAEVLHLKDGLDQGDWENFLNLVKEDKHGIWGELVELVQESNYLGGQETLLGVNVMNHLKPSAIHLEPRSLTLYGEYNSSPENARLVREADRNLKSWFGLGLDSIEGLESDHWI